MAAASARCPHSARCSWKDCRPRRDAGRGNQYSSASSSLSGHTIDAIAAPFELRHSSMPADGPSSGPDDRGRADLALAADSAGRRRRLDGNGRLARRSRLPAHRHLLASLLHQSRADVFLFVSSSLPRSAAARGSMAVSAGLIALASAIGVVLAVGRCSGRPGIFVAATAMMFYLRFLDFGLLVSTWPADVQILPTLLATVLFAAVAAGRWGCLPLAVAAVSLPIQTNVAYIPALGVMGVLAMAGGALARVRRGMLGASCGAGVSPAQAAGTAAPQERPRGRFRNWLLLSLAALAVLWTPVFVRELTQPQSDTAKMVRYFLEHGPGHTWRESQAGCLPVYGRLGGLCAGSNSDSGNRETDGPD